MCKSYCHYCLEDIGYYEKDIIEEVIVQRVKVSLHKQCHQIVTSDSVLTERFLPRKIEER